MIKDEILLYVCIDGEDGDTDVTDDVVDTPEVETEVPEQEEEVEEENVPINEIDLDGEKITLEQIKQFKQGYNSYSKQVSDYKALQEQSKDALELFNYIKSNPELAQKLYEYDAEISSGNLKDKLPSKEKEEISTLRREMTAIKIDAELSSIKAKDASVDEIALLQIATEKGLPLDIAYKVWKADNYDTELKSKLKEQSKSITKDLQNAKKTTKTLITEDAGKADDGTFGLSKQEIAMANKLEISLEDYSRWKK